MTLLLSAIAALSALLPAQSMPTTTRAADGVLRPARGFVLKSVGQYARSAIHVDPLEAEIVAGRWKPPQDGEPFRFGKGQTRPWREITAAEGEFRDDELADGYLYVPVNVESPRTVLLEAAGHGLVYANGEPRTGDPYNFGFVRLPVALRAGTNHLLFLCRRPSIRLELKHAPAAVVFNPADTTLPDLLVGDDEPLWAAIVVVNTTADWRHGITLDAAAPSARSHRTALPPLPPLSTRKVGFQLPSIKPGAPGDLLVSLMLNRPDAPPTEPKPATMLRVKIVRPDQSRCLTFRSQIDDSIQYYAINPAVPSVDAGSRPALYLTLHGANVEAISQANAYAAKPGGVLVAPTNRRRYGFDWEDWGRLDALEVLTDAAARFNTDPGRTYLTGHSMGGHGTWHLGATYPDRFAAIGPSAGWSDFWSYGGATRFDDADPIGAMLRRATAPSRTLDLLTNLAPLGVYVLHGDADDNVPVQQARAMKARLATFHRNVLYHEQPNASHWWDLSDAPGADCVDWPAMFEMFSKRRLPERAGIREIDFATAAPGVSATCGWLRIDAQIRPYVVSRVQASLDAEKRALTAKTENVARMEVDLPALGKLAPHSIRIDDSELADFVQPPSGGLRLERADGRWRVVAPPPPTDKNPQRSGPFRDAFRRRVQFVYGTKGNAAENAWSFAKARFDAETFWYRGNGSIEWTPDHQFDPAAEPDRNIIIYGNADTNTAWPALLKSSPIQVARVAVRAGERTLSGNDLACLFIRPRPGSDSACVGVVSGTGLPGMRLTERIPIFTSGVAYPDCIVFAGSYLSEGLPGVRAAGFFGNDWSVERGEFAWRDVEKKD